MTNTNSDDEIIKSKVGIIQCDLEQEISNEVLDDILDYAQYKCPERFKK